MKTMHLGFFVVVVLALH